MMTNPNDIRRHLQQLQKLDEAELLNIQKDLADQIEQREESLCQDLEKMNKQLLDRQAAVRDWVTAKSTLRKAVSNYKRRRFWNTIQSKVLLQKNTKERDEKLKELGKIQQEKGTDEKNKKKRATELIDTPVPNWRQQIQKISEVISVAQRLELKLTTSALKNRFKADWNWIDSVAKKATQGGITTLLTSAIAPIVALSLVVAKEIYYYKQFKFDIVPYIPRPTISLDSDLRTCIRSDRRGGSRYVQRKEWRRWGREGSP